MPANIYDSRVAVHGIIHAGGGEMFPIIWEKGGEMFPIIWEHIMSMGSCRECSHMLGKENDTVFVSSKALPLLQHRSVPSIVRAGFPVPQMGGD